MGSHGNRCNGSIIPVVVGAAIVVSMTGWLYALGWGALNLVRLIKWDLRATKARTRPDGIADITLLQQAGGRRSVHF